MSDDPLAPAKGIFNGVLIGTLLWAVIIWGICHVLS